MEGTLKGAIVLAVIAAAVIIHSLIREKKREKAAREQAARAMERRTVDLTGAAAIREDFRNPTYMELSPGWKMEALPLEEIFAIENKQELVAQMTVYLAQKCDYGEGISVLTEAEKVVYLTILMEAEVHNGGFDQYFFNPSGNHANEVVDALAKLGASRMAAICKRVMTIFGDSVPKDWNERIEAFSELNENDGAAMELLNECNDAFFENEEDLTDLCYQYIMNNKDRFC